MLNVLKKEDVLIDHSRSPREAIDVLDVRSTTTRRGTYTQYLVHWQGQAGFEDAWISSEELKKLDQLLWEDLISNSMMSLEVSSVPFRHDTAQAQHEKTRHGPGLGTAQHGLSGHRHGARKWWGTTR